MLILSRTRDQKIKIGDDIEVTIVDIRGEKVRIGIDAPKAIGVHRLEVYDAIKAAEAAVVATAAKDMSAQALESGAVAEAKP